MTQDGTTGLEATSTLKDTFSEIPGPNSLSATFFKPSAYEVAQVTFSTDVNGKTVQLDATELTSEKNASFLFNDKPVLDNNDIFKDFGSFDNMSVAAIEIDHSGMAKYPNMSTIEIGTPAANADQFTLSA